MTRRTNLIRDYADRYIAAGYSPLPILPRAKNPGTTKNGTPRPTKGWQKLCNRTLLPGELDQIAARDVACGIGIALGFGGVVALDMDRPDGCEIGAALIDIIPDSPVEKVGSKGFTRFYRAADTKAAKWHLRFTEDGQPSAAGKPQPVLELLGHGNQTVIPPTIHPKTQKPYEWTDRALSEVPAASLPLLPETFAATVVEALQPFGYGQHQTTGEGHTRAALGAGEGIGSADPFVDLNARSLAALGRWIGDLRGATIVWQNGDSYRLRADWRGGDGPNITADGELIFDHTRKDGLDGVLSPIDIVMLSEGVDIMAAMDWLEQRVDPERHAAVAAFIAAGGFEEMFQRGAA